MKMKLTFYVMLQISKLKELCYYRVEFQKIISHSEGLKESKNEMNRLQNYPPLPL